jgi:Arc/MetJ-type ribon-helix-helix transcriptional regulator
MSRGKPYTPKSIRLPAHQLEYIQSLKGLGIFGTLESDIVRALIDRAINDLNQSRYIRNHLEDMDLLKNSKPKD